MAGEKGCESRPAKSLRCKRENSCTLRDFSLAANQSISRAASSQGRRLALSACFPPAAPESSRVRLVGHVFADFRAVAAAGSQASGPLCPARWRTMRLCRMVTA